MTSVTTIINVPVAHNGDTLMDKRGSMIDEKIFYLFLFPWMLFIASMPAAVLTFLFSGLAAQLLNYLPNGGVQQDKVKS